MNPIDVIKWTCVIIFILTAILTLMHVSGIRLLPDPDHGKLLFKALIIEIVVIAVSVFSNTVLHNPEEIFLEKLPNNETRDYNANSPNFHVDAEEELENNVQNANNNCQQITITDYSKIPPISKIINECN
ncbi:hypothetical protein [Nitrosomonas ureae]|uniref:hypothetical protein n=1 Tax=Nitrosomonas ureae TaxID=44577 RepID=UPI0007214543|nr:hypothetical protein [Nitrosomonas ureae]ALQ50474.1 hypothetical protein ATY38_04020 [Nitrosomonas ureae]